MISPRNMGIKHKNKVSIKKRDRSGSKNLDTLIITENCPTCKFPNYNIHGVKQNNELMITLSCMSCGNKIQKINQKFSNV
jgi:hypothetical protein